MSNLSRQVGVGTYLRSFFCKMDHGKDSNGSNNHTNGSSFGKKSVQPSKFPACFILSVSALMLVTSFVTLAVVWYPTSIQDLLINLGWIGVQQQPLISYKYSDIGRKIMSKTNVTILGVGRNFNHRIPGILPQLELLCSKFAACQVIIIDGQSTDGSTANLQTWAKRSPSNRSVHSIVAPLFEPSGFFKNEVMPREGRITHARNTALQLLSTMPYTEYVMPLDLDIVGWNIYGVQDSFGRPSWDVICANGVLLHGIFRDTYAFRTSDIDTNHHWFGTDYARYNIPKRDLRKNINFQAYSKQKAQNLMLGTSVPGSMPKPFAVDSCFGGMAIYRHAALRGCQYDYRYNIAPFMQDCEHVILHKCMREKNKARIYANPHMKLWYGHSDFSELKWKRVLVSLLPSFLVP